MILIKDISQLNKLIKKAKRISEVIVTNFFLMAGQINDYINQNQLFSNFESNGLHIICEEEDFYYLYFFIATDKYPQNIPWLRSIEKPVVIDFLYHEGNKPRSIVDAENIWLELGFARYGINRRMTLTLSESAIKELRIKTLENNSLQKKTYYIDFAKPANCKAIMMLWRNNMDKYSIPLPKWEEIEKSITNHQVICGYNSDNQIIAANKWKENKNVWYHGPLAVNQKYRRLGVAQAIFDFKFSLANPEIKNIHWVNELNHPIIKLSLNFGYQFDGLINEQLIAYP